MRSALQSRASALCAVSPSGMPHCGTAIHQSLALVPRFEMPAMERRPIENTSLPRTGKYPCVGNFPCPGAAASFGRPSPAGRSVEREARATVHADATFRADQALNRPAPPATRGATPDGGTAGSRAISPPTPARRGAAKYPPFLWTTLGGSRALRSIRVRHQPVGRIAAKLGRTP